MKSCRGARGSVLDRAPSTLGRACNLFCSADSTAQAACISLASRPASNPSLIASCSLTTSRCKAEEASPYMAATFRCSPAMAPFVACAWRASASSSSSWRAANSACAVKLSLALVAASVSSRWEFSIPATSGAISSASSSPRMIEMFWLETRLHSIAISLFETGAVTIAEEKSRCFSCKSMASASPSSSHSSAMVRASSTAALSTVNFWLRMAWSNAFRAASSRSDTIFLAAMTRGSRSDKPAP
mmetsp:Transcript_77306/g.145788  ORF Transcript_77306/g.145788 Transcript_77306/m.145788 type:complete len:244 (+) Transcript_77306:618-1349(+)